MCTVSASISDFKSSRQKTGKLCYGVLYTTMSGGTVAAFVPGAIGHQ
jgi:hypothetical protein